LASFGEEWAERRGVENQVCVLRHVQAFAEQYGIRSARIAEFNGLEDRSGKDIVIVDAAGVEVWLQVKSSQKGVEKFRRQVSEKGDLGILIVLAPNSEDSLREAVKQVLDSRVWPK
jgi:hypothetical protein